MPTTVPLPSTESIYRTVAGPAFDALPEVIRRAHEVPLRARGEVDVRWSARPLSRLLARVMRLPPEGAAMPLRLVVRRSRTGRVVYDRSFGAFHLRTLQDAAGGLLREKAGAAEFCFRLEADEARLVYRTARCRLLGVPLPRWMAARTTATIEPFGEGWRAKIEVEMPGLGRICEYEARMRFIG